MERAYHPNAFKETSIQSTHSKFKTLFENASKTHLNNEATKKLIELCLEVQIRTPIIKAPVTAVNNIVDDLDGKSCE